MRMTIALAATLALGACANQANTIPALEQGLTAAEKLASNYIALPACPAGATSLPGGLLCSQATVVAQIKTADQTAYAAVKAAEANQTSVLVSAAAAALAALTQIVPALQPAN